MKSLKSISLTIFALFFALNINTAANDKDIVEVAVSAGNFTTLATALTEAGLVDALKGEGPFTVFAPTDEAFANLPEGALENLLKDKEALKQVLLYHVVQGNLMASDVVKLDEASTLSGKNVSVNTDKDGVLINKSRVVSADIKASNGVIHVIDTVLLPPSDKQKAKSTY
jgi:uncharacterized surface protein with fasciclin (FAS1) repeats